MLNRWAVFADRCHCDWLLPLIVWIASGAGFQVSAQPVTATAQAVPGDPDLAGLVKLLRSGDYERCIVQSTEAIDRRVFGEDWYLIKAEAEAALGRYSAALETTLAGLQRYSWSIRLRQRGVDIARHAGRPEQAGIWQAEVLDYAGRAPWRYTDSDNLVALGRAALANGIDARQILEQLYDRALKQSPKHRDAWLASGEMALTKQDFQLAATTFRAAVKEYPGDADLQLGLARSLEYRDPKLAAAAVASAQAANPQHVPSWIYRAEQALDAERYADAEEFLRQALAVHPHHADVWALMSVLAHLTNDPRGAEAYHDKALSTWALNPHVDHLIGRKLSQKYRFAEGAARQKNSLTFEPAYIPAKTQLVQDLLRLGQDADAWTLADAVQQQDGYDVQVFNLLELRDKLAQYRELEQDGFRVRMTAQEADIYGGDVLALLSKARSTLCAKYELDLKDTITVEIYPEPNDFAVKTFGMPGASGYLGVCFGKVITANSPASQAEHPANWQAVLWHEFCHVVTLELTHNRMPRWLSEGISVYEERQADPSWGERMNPRYRQWILSGRMTPLEEMSGAFLSPESGQHLQFAYFQSSLIVEFLMEIHGLAKLREVLTDLAGGLPVNVALERRIAPVLQLDREFQDYAREQARQFGPNLDWEEYDLSAVISDDDPERLAGWVQDHPDSVSGLTAWVQSLLERREWEQAKVPVRTLIDAAPEYAGAGNFYRTLAVIHQQLGETAAERAVLEEYARRADAPVAPLLRLIELQQDAADWTAVMKSVNKLRQINPLLPALHRIAAIAAEQTGSEPAAILAWRSRLTLGTEDRAEAHYRLARLLQRQGDPQARREVLRALEVAPRYRAAQELLLEIVAADPASALVPENTASGETSVPPVTAF